VRTFFASGSETRARGDVTPTYLYFGEKVIPRIRDTYGDEPPRFVVTLRDPVERAWSRYWHERRVAGREPLSFEDALVAEPDRLRADALGHHRRGRFPHAYFRGGLYAEQLERYRAVFSHTRLHVLLFEDLTRDFEGTIRDLLAFLAVDPTVAVEPVRRNAAATARLPGLDRWLRPGLGVGRAATRLLSPRMLSYVRRALRRPFLKPFSYPPMDVDTERALRRRYLPDVQRLEAITGRDLSSWYPREDARASMVPTSGISGAAP